MDFSHLIRTPEEVNRLFPWLGSELIRGIPHFISPAWTSDRSQFDADHWAEAWQRIGFETVTLLTGHHDGYLLYPSKLSKQQPDRDYFGEQVTACRERGMRVMAYYSLTLDSLVGSEHPEWRVRDMEGRVHQPNYEHFSHYHWLCLNSPYCEYVVGQLEEVVTNYDVEGVWIDILYLPGHTSDLTRETCFCDHCHRQYSEWYRGEHLLDAAGTPRHDEFRALTYRNFLAELKTMLMARERPVALTFNGAGRRRMKQYKMCDDLTDFLSGEAHNPLSLSLTSKSHRNDGRPFELLSCAEVCWSHNQLKPDTLIRLESLSTLIAGGTYTIGVTLAPDGRLSEANVDRLAQWGSWVRERADLFRDSVPVYEMGLLTPELGPTGCEAWVEILRKGHFGFNAFMDLDLAVGRPLSGEASTDGLSDYRLIVVPASRPLSDADALRLREYAEAGGMVLLECPAAELRRASSAVQELIGARLVREDSAYAYYLKALEDALSVDLPPGDPVLVYSGSALILEPTTAAAAAELVPQFRDKVRTSDIQTVANFWAREDQCTGHPGILMNHIGAGCVMTGVLAVTARNRDGDRCPWPTMLAQNWVRRLLGEQHVSVGAYSRVEVQLCRQPERLVLHFLNHGYGPGEFIHGHGEQEFLRELPVTLGAELGAKVVRAVLEPQGVEAPLSEGVLTLPHLGVHQAVALHWD